MPKTVEEIARETGFSITTVRFVINGQSERYRISAATKKQIEDYIAIYGYSINHAARSLKLNRSDTVGLVVPDLANAFFARFMAALETLCRERDLLLLTVASHEDPQLEDRAIGSLLARGVDGLVIAPCQSAVLAQLQKNKTRTPVVMFDRDYHPLLFPSVVSDNFTGGLEMARQMLEESAGDCYFLCGDYRLPSIQDRIRGFLAAAERREVAAAQDLIKLEADNSTLAGHQLMAALIAGRGAPPPAFMCSSLLVLEGALAELKATTGRIDKDILIATFDDHAMLDLLPNRVLSIRQNEAELAARVFARLAAPKGEGKAVTGRDVVPVELVVRNF